LKPSKSTSAAFSRLPWGLSGASVSRTCQGHKGAGVDAPGGMPRHGHGTHRVLLRGHGELLPAVDVLPQPLHVLPVRHDPVLHGVAQPAGPPMLLQLTTHHPVGRTSCFETSGPSTGKESADTHTSEPSNAPPGIILMCFGRPTAEDTTTFGRSPPANPALMTPDDDVCCTQSST
jgi:hypothetical protein